VCVLYHLMVRVAQSSSHFVRMTVDLRRRGGMWRSSDPPGYIYRYCLLIAGLREESTWRGRRGRLV